MDFELEIQKTNIGIRISISRYSVCQFSGKTDNFDFFGPNLHRYEFWGRNFEFLSPDSESALPRYHVCQFSGKTNNFDFFGPNLPRNEFWGRNFEFLSPDSESATPIYLACQCSGKTDNFEFFSLNLGKLLNYMRYFGSYNVESVAESWVEARMSWVEVDGADWRWMELGGGGWSWVEVGARFSSTHFILF